MGTTIRPDTAEAILDAVAWAAASDTPLEIIGHGSRRAIGAPMNTEHTIDLSHLTGVTLYEPDELVLSARAGTPMSEITKLLRDNNQDLAFEPPDPSRLLGGYRGRGTIGGVLASNMSGPRRIKTGAVRDHILGVQAISGRGEMFKSGGRVVKNVTGYDLSKVMAGSWGTLAVVTELTLKVLPRPEYVSTLVIAGMSDDAGVKALCAAMGSPWDVSGAAHIPENVVPEIPDAAFAAGGRAVTLLRLEGFEPSIAYRAERLKTMFRQKGEVTVLGATSSEPLWRSIRDAEPFRTQEEAVWRISVAPTEGPKLIAALRPKITPYRHFYDWSGGLVWLEVGDAAPDAHATRIRQTLRMHGGGHATLMRGSPALRSSVPVFEPQPLALADLSRRLKEQFDPKGILNPGRMGMRA